MSSTLVSGCLKVLKQYGSKQLQPLDLGTNLSYLTGMENSLNTRPYLTRNEVAEYVGLSWKTIERWEDKGLPSYDVGGRILYLRREVDDFILSHRRSGRGLRFPQI